MDLPPTHLSRPAGRRLRRKVYELLEAEEAPSLAGRLAARLLTFLILLSTAAAVLDTVESLHRAWRPLLLGIEIVCVALFTVEYAARVWSAVEDRAGRYNHPLWGRLRFMLTPLAPGLSHLKPDLIPTRRNRLRAGRSALGRKTERPR
jgi:voltage-gated potassium channel